MPTLGVFTAAGLDVSIQTLEDPWLDNRPNVSCIPEGDYPLVYVRSERLKKFTPRLLGVPNRSGILVHGGDVAADTDGCILAGLERLPDGRSIHNCPPAVAAVVRWLVRVLGTGPAVCRIVRAAAVPAAPASSPV
jgi:hypothetical protein